MLSNFVSCQYATLHHCSLQGAKFEESEKFWAKFSDIFKFANCTGGFWSNLNENVQYFGVKQMFRTLETELLSKF